MPAPFSEQVPPFAQVSALQSLTSSAHAVPSQPDMHAQTVLPVPSPASAQVPCALLVHVVAVQSTASRAQVAPAQPDAHAQDVRPVPAPFSEQVPPFAQVVAVQSTVSVHALAARV